MESAPTKPPAVEHRAPPAATGSADDAYRYVGEELDVFRFATNWKSYFADIVRPYLGASVMEVGAGLGETTKFLCTPAQQQWVCLEPDERLAARIRGKIAAGDLPGACEVRVGSIDDERRTFETIVYIDVLEHIEQDREEVEKATARLKPGGHLVILSPAHAWLYTAFDRAIGHCRRYTKRTLARAIPDGLTPVRVAYLDSCGMLASLANKVLLRRAAPTRQQILLWDRMMIPVSRWLDKLTLHGLGKSVVGVYRKR